MAKISEDEVSVRTDFSVVEDIAAELSVLVVRKLTEKLLKPVSTTAVFEHEIMPAIVDATISMVAVRCFVVVNRVVGCQITNLKSIIKGLIIVTLSTNSNIC